MLSVHDPNVESATRPYAAAWFGNFFEPYYSDRDAVDHGLADLKAMGFNCVVLDSKLWADFSSFFKGGSASDYVAMQQYIVERCRVLGLGVTFLALYNCGDNLYPDIYPHPPEFVNPPRDRDGKPLRGYRHWCNEQMAAQVAHCLDLYDKLAGAAAAKALDEDGNERLPFYFYHSPAFCPSFDENGQQHYLDWLSSQYDVETLNARYDCDFRSWCEVKHGDVWHGIDPSDVPGAEDYANRSPTLRMFADNQRYRYAVMGEFMAKITAELRRCEPRFYIYACLTQWKLLFTDWIPIHSRGLDPWVMGRLLDSPMCCTHCKSAKVHWTITSSSSSLPTPFTVNCAFPNLNLLSNSS